MKKRWSRWHVGVWMALLFFAIPSSFLLGEVIYLQNGGRIEGKILEWKEESVVVKTKWGVIKVLKDEIKSIEKAKSVKEIFQKRWEKLDRYDGEGFFQLGKWCQEQGLKKEAEKCFRKTLDIMPAHRGAHLALGHRFFHGRWMEYDEYMKARGFVFYAGKWMTKSEYEYRRQGYIKFEGQWMTKKRFEKIRRQRLLEIKWGSSSRSSKKYKTGKSGTSLIPPKPIQVPDDVKELLIMARSSHRDKRLAAYRALKRKGGDALRALAQQLVREKEKIIQKIKDYFRSNASRLIPKLGRLLNQRRKAARDFIMDPQKYPDANHGRAAQPQVDELVNQVRQVYEHPFKEVISKSKSLKNLLKNLEQVIDDLKTYCSLPENFDYEVENLDKKISKAINMERRFAPPGSFQILEYNRRVKTSVDQEERNCILVTNRYRMMMGLKPLKIDEPLVQAARKHSDDMRRKGYFSHTSQDGRSPAQRCAAEGATYYSGENIAQGMTTGEAAFKAWYNSSGHHRNMLTRHTSIGVGRSGRYWTEDFGVGTSTKR